MNIRQITYSILLSVLAGSSGYYSHALHPDTVSFVPIRSMPAMDYFFAPQSFSVPGVYCCGMRSAISLSVFMRGDD